MCPYIYRITNVDQRRKLLAPRMTRRFLTRKRQLESFSKTVRVQKEVRSYEEKDSLAHEDPDIIEKADLVAAETNMEETRKTRNNDKAEKAEMGRPSLYALLSNCTLC